MIDYNALAADYALYRKAHPEVVRELISTSHIDPDSYVLEVGCGTGNYINAIRTATGCHCSGIDPSEQMLAQARQHYPDIVFDLARAEKLMQPDGLFDLVFSVDVIHHVSGLDAYFSEAFRTLKPGGWLCTVTDSKYVIRNRSPLTEYFPETVTPELERYPRISDLIHSMGLVGLTDVTESLVEFHYQLSHCGAYKSKAYSALHLIPQAAFERGIARMEHDLQSGPIACVSRYVMLWGRKPTVTAAQSL